MATTPTMVTEAGNFLLSRTSLLRTHFVVNVPLHFLNHLLNEDSKNKVFRVPPNTSISFIKVKYDMFKVLYSVI